MLVPADYADNSRGRHEKSFANISAVRGECLYTTVVANAKKTDSVK